ncbi:MAG TPA: hypothetical protein VMY99_02930 [Nevskiaceae bacterium]|nr:hypothetical protein [Nevskiaceae bacterium]
MSETVGKCPIDHAIMQVLYQENGHIGNKLQGLVEPLADALSERIVTNVAHSDVVSNWPGQEKEIITTGLPYSPDARTDPYRMLPPNFFGSFASPENLIIPANSTGRQQLIEDFLARHEEDLRQGSVQGATKTSAYFAEMLPARLEFLAEQGTSVNPTLWTQYQGAAHRQRNNGWYHLSNASDFRNHNVSAMLHDPVRSDLLDTAATGKFDSYMYRATAMLIDKDDKINPLPSGYLFVPVGEYGVGVAKKLLQTTLYTVEYAQTSLPPLANELATGHEEIIQRHTARGKHREPEIRLPGEALVATTQEGVLSIMQTAALLTAEHIEGYDDPVLLLRDIIDAGLVEQFTRAVPMGVVGPFVLAGAYFPGIIQNKGGQLYLNPEVMAKVKHTKQQQAASAIREWDTYRGILGRDKGRESPSVTGLICPGAAPHGAVTKLSRAMMRAIEAIDPDEAQRLDLSKLMREILGYSR